MKALMTILSLGLLCGMAVPVHAEGLAVAPAIIEVQKTYQEQYVSLQVTNTNIVSTEYTVSAENTAIQPLQEHFILSPSQTMQLPIRLTMNTAGTYQDQIKIVSQDLVDPAIKAGVIIPVSVSVQTNPVNVFYRIISVAILLIFIGLSLIAWYLNLTNPITLNAYVL